MAQEENLSFDSNLDSVSVKEKKEIPTLIQFLILSILSMGLYSIWWMYKSWRFFKEKDNLDIYPAARAIFNVFFLYSLMVRTQNYASKNNYTVSYSASPLIISYILLNILSRLPDPYWMISFLSILTLIPSFMALNFAQTNDDTYHIVEQKGLNDRQKVIVLVGILFWVLLLLGLVFVD